MVLNNIRHLISATDSGDPTQQKKHTDMLYKLASTPPPKLEHPIVNSTVRALKCINDLHTNNLVMLQRNVETLHKIAFNINSQHNKISMQSWVNKALDPTQGYRIARAFSRGCAKAPPMPEVVIHDGKILCNSTDLAEHYLEQWTLLWQNQQAHAEIQ